MAIKSKAQKLRPCGLVFDNGHDCKDIGLAEIVHILNLVESDVPMRGILRRRLMYFKLIGPQHNETLFECLHDHIDVCLIDFILQNGNLQQLSEILAHGVKIHIL